MHTYKTLDQTDIPGRLVLQGLGAEQQDRNEGPVS